MNDHRVVSRCRACVAAVIGLVLLAAFVSAPRADESWPVQLTDIAAQAGLTSPSIYGGVDRKRFIIETNGAGVALIDYDRDGWLDALVLSGTRLADGERRDASFGAAPATTTTTGGRICS